MEEEMLQAVFGESFQDDGNFGMSIINTEEGR